MEHRTKLVYLGAPPAGPRVYRAKCSCGETFVASTLKGLRGEVAAWHAEPIPYNPMRTIEALERVVA